MKREAPIEFIEEVCGVYFRSIVLACKGDRVGQHVHSHDHATYCGRGSAALFVEGKQTAVVVEGCAIPVLANVSHEFVALEDNTRLTCVHNADSALSIKERGL